MVPKCVGLDIIVGYKCNILKYKMTYYITKQIINFVTILQHLVNSATKLNCDNVNLNSFQNTVNL